MGRIEVGQVRYKLLGPVRDLRAALQQAGQRLAVQHPEAGHPGTGARPIPAHRGRAVDDEPLPLLLGERGVLDQAA